MENVCKGIIGALPYSIWLISSYLFFDILFPKRKIRALYKIIFILIVAAFLLIDNGGIFSYMAKIFVLPLILLVFFKSCVWGALFMGVSLYTVFFSLTFAIEKLWKGIPLILNKILPGAILAAVLYLAAAIIFRKILKTQPNEYRAFPWILMMYPVFGGFFAINAVIHENNIPAFSSLIYILASVFSVAAGLLQMYNENRYLRTEENLKTVSRQLERQNSYYQSMDMFEKEFKSAWHDYKNHMICIFYMLKSEDYKGLKEYVSDVGNMVDEPLSLITGNIVCDSILAEKRRVAYQNNILLMPSVKLPKYVNISDTDFCIILGNILDNAIEACQSMGKEGGRKKVELRIGYKNDYIHIYIKNPLQDGNAPKKSGVFCGIGIENTKRTVEKYEGNLHLEQRDGEFITEVIMKNMGVD